MLQFTDAVELRNHYAEIKRKFQGPRYVNYVTMPDPPPPKVVEKPKPRKKLPFIPDHLLEQYQNGPVNKIRLKMRQVVKEMAEKHNMSVETLMSATRIMSIVRARQEAMYHIKMETGCSFLELARFFRKDHTTIMHGIERHLERINK
jgi:hypothetical protein